MKIVAAFTLLAAISAEHLESKLHDSKFAKHPHVPFERGPLECTCPKHFELNGDHCERIKHSPLEIICPVGYYLTKDDLCVKQTHPIEKCPYGYAKVKDECVRREVEIPKLGCPSGYELETTTPWLAQKKVDQLICSKKVHVKPAYECPDGTNYHGECLAPITYPAEYICPAGFIPAGEKTCWREDTVDCGKSKKEHHAAGPFVPGSYEVHRPNLRKLSADVEGFGQKDGYTHKDGHQEIWNTWHEHHHIVSTPPKVLDIKQHCTAEVTIPATAYCPQGALKGELCEEKVPTAPIKVCPAYGTLHDCYQYERQNPKAICPKGFKQECKLADHLHPHNSLDCECVKTEIVPVEIICPPGSMFEDGVCVVYAKPYKGCPAHSHVVDGKCQSIEVKPCICTYNVHFACHGPSCHDEIHEHHEHYGHIAH